MHTAPADPDRPDDAAHIGRLTDPQWFALSWYGQTIDVLCRKKDLQVVRPERGLPPTVERLPSARTGHLVAITDGIRDRVSPGPGAVVVGGPCMGDCMQFPTLEALYDVVQPLLTAEALGLPVLLYLGDQEEMIERGGTGKWGDLALRFEAWILELGRTLGLEDDAVRVVRTSTAEHGAALETAAEAWSGCDRQLLDSVFHLAMGVAPSGSESSRVSSGRVVQAHLPSVVAAHLGRPTDEVLVLVAENLQQAGVVQMARTVASDGEAPRIELIAHWPAPGLSATERMFRSGAWDKVPAWELNAVARGDMSGMHPYTCEFFATWRDEASRTKLVDATLRVWDKK